MIRTEGDTAVISKEDFNFPSNPCKHIILDTLSGLDVFVWGEYVANGDILRDFSRDSSISQAHLGRMYQSEEEFMHEQLWDNEKDEFPKYEMTNKQHDLEYISSVLYPVDKNKLQVIQTILNSFDALVLGDQEVFPASYMKENFTEIYDYQQVMMYDYDAQFEDELAELEKEV